MSEGWSLTESDPAIFTTLLEELGVIGLQVEELWSLDKEALNRLEPVHALIFLFKYIDSHQNDPLKQAGTLEVPPPGTYFAQQVIANACATLAILNAVMNVTSDPTAKTVDGVSIPPVELGEELNQLKSFSADLDPQTRGEVLTNSEKLRTVHNSFARPNPFHLDEPKSSTSKDAYHFITYIPVQGKLYELDGLKPLPVSHGQIPIETNWTEKAQKVIENRINTYSSTEVHFNLMAICGDRLKVLENKLFKLQEKQAQEFLVNQLHIEIDEEIEKRKRWKFENSVRRHNHIGLANALLMALAKSGKLSDQIELAKKKMNERRSKGQQDDMEIDMD
ncbi:hypothetical protein CROQUDRAFT_658449 [Cronartium quercuum f. sp. fusiforme G11]|uniref:Ubiquitin carboxyl-terminal hydrolase n=1 Tax=Cronartium quercuum f. sp. fusiforme G11 TaxID=708437 RepID=A0A9P6NLA6_9BASI|nr:hypothetical protein CROQUDRAFT_658449 [Cronartium quercuum f. sp. fusiforme G11]